MNAYIKIFRTFLINVSMFMISIFLALLLGEGIIRIFCKPVDFLKPELIADNILKVKIKPNASGHDSWGFRNSSVPKKADIITIGDSQTYGVSATSSNSWPSQLGKITNKNVYNLALGGYGPVDYLYLLENKAVYLNPSLIIVGFYFGNDISDAYISIYNLDYYKELRKTQFENEQEENKIKDFVISEDYNHKFGGRIRDLLSKHSVLYRVTTYSIGNVLRFAEMKYLYPDKDVTIYEDIKNNIHTCFTPLERLNSLNLDSSSVNEGLNLSLGAFDKMNQICLSRKIEFLVVLLPTKENVYSEYIENNSGLNNSKVINYLLLNERIINKMIKDYFREHNIKYIDPLNSMRNSIKETPPYPSGDSHPNKYGYGVIAKEVYLGLNGK